MNCSSGFIFDGFPRTCGQAEWLDTYVPTRIQRETGSLHAANTNSAGRWQRKFATEACPTCQLVYNIHIQPPRIDGTCDFDGCRLVAREDDWEETILERFRIYERETLPIMHYYAQQGKLVQIDGDLPVDTVTKETLQVIKNWICK